MITKLENKLIKNSLLTVPEFNYGQMQRWLDHKRLRYSIEISFSFLLKNFGN